MTAIVALFVLAGLAQQPLPQSLPSSQVQPLPASTPFPQTPVVFSLAEFSRAFTPVAGTHQVWFVHPSTKDPVEVNFTLPPGRMKRFEVADHALIVGAVESAIAGQKAEGDLSGPLVYFDRTFYTLGRSIG